LIHTRITSCISKNKKITIEKLKEHKDWKSTLTKELGDNFEVLSPQMPNNTNVCYKENELGDITKY